jgi:hypothetical protein
MPEEFFRGYTITHILDCLADPTKIRVIAAAERLVDDIFPYLNAIIPNGPTPLGPTPSPSNESTASSPSTLTSRSWPR